VIWAKVSASSGSNWGAFCRSLPQIRVARAVMSASTATVMMTDTRTGRLRRGRRRNRSVAQPSHAAKPRARISARGRGTPHLWVWNSAYAVNIAIPPTARFKIRDAR